LMKKRNLRHGLEQIIKFVPPFLLQNTIYQLIFTTFNIHVLRAKGHRLNPKINCS